MVSTSIYSAATLDCFCRSHEQVQRCTHVDLLRDFLSVLVALVGFLAIVLMYTKVRTIEDLILCKSLKYARKYVEYLAYLRLYEGVLVLRFIFPFIVRYSMIPWKLTVYLGKKLKATVIPRHTDMRKVTADLCVKPVRTVDNPIKISCLKYQQQCEAWIDYKILRLTLIKIDHTFSHKRNKRVPIDYLFDSIGFEKFIDCLELSLKEPSFFHLGHYSLLKLLTPDSETGCLLESDDYICNLKIQSIIQDNIFTFIELVNVQELLPIMEDKRLLTNRDKEVLNSKFRTYTDKAEYLLTELLVTKGHYGYVLFLECLENEHSHTGHCEVAEKISRELHNCQIRRPPKCSLKELQVWYHCKGLMNTREYIEAFDNFMYLSQSNDVRKFNYEVKRFVVTHKKTPEAEAFGLMMKALSFKFRCKDWKLSDVKFRTEQCIVFITDSDDRRNFEGLWYLILSCWHHHQRNCQSARTYLEKAKAELISGNGRALVLYVEASLLIEDKSGNEDKIIALLQDAIRGFRSRPSDGVSIMQMRCYLQKAQCHIGSTLNSPRIARRSPSQLHEAMDILSMLAEQLDVLPLRLKMQYYAIMCDYHRVCDRKEEATDCIHKGLSLDTNNIFKRDQRFLQDRKSEHHA